MSIPDIVILGHICQDLQSDGSYRLGGTVTYASLLAHNLGLKIGIATSAPDIVIANLTELIPHLNIVSIHTASATIFENIYTETGRQQYVRDQASPITIDIIPPQWYTSPLILFGPVANEIPSNIPPLFTNNFCRAATPQGWLRDWDDSGKVQPVPWKDAEHILSYLDLLVLSHEDLSIAVGTKDPLETIAYWATQIPYLALTNGKKGAHIWCKERTPWLSPAFSVNEVDPTGAGDIFATAMLIALWMSKGNIDYAVRFAHAAASFVVQAPGITGIPSRDEVESRI
jgi:1D-myo-inositol 3-kinase